MYGGVRGRKTIVGGRLCRFPPTRFPRLYTLLFTPYTSGARPLTFRLIAYFATSTLQNELLVIIDQQKVDFILIFAA